MKNGEEVEGSKSSFMSRFKPTCMFSYFKGTVSLISKDLPQRGISFTTMLFNLCLIKDFVDFLIYI